MKQLKIGLLFAGNYTNSPFGSAITTFYLAKALREMGHETWLVSVTKKTGLDLELVKNTDFLISEGVPHWQIANAIWESSSVRIFWWLSKLFYDEYTISSSPFDGIATNSKPLFDRMKVLGIPAAKIDLCADRSFVNATPNRKKFYNDCVYLGKYPHKNSSQLDLMFEGAVHHNLGIWGTGWAASKYAAAYRGVLPFDQIASLYKSSTAAFLLTEERQKQAGMINNRTFEILASGCVPISEDFETLQNSDLGEFIYFVDNSEQVNEILTSLSKRYTETNSRLLSAQKMILEKHTYQDRARHFINFFQSIIS